MFGLVLRGVDLARVQTALTSARYEYLAPAVLLLVLGMFTRAIRWRTLLMDRLPLMQAFGILNISYLFNGALPFRLGEVARIFLVTRTEEPIPAFTTLSTILVERLIDLLAVIAMLGVVLVILPVPGYVTTAGLVLGGSSLVGLIVLVSLARRPGWAFAMPGWLERRLPLLRRWNLGDALEKLIEGLQPLTSVRRVGLAVGWSLVSWALSVVAGYVLLFAFFPTASWTTTMLFIVMASLAVTVPYAPGAVGPYEAGVVMALTLTGYEQPEGAAVAFAIVLHAVNTGVYVLLGAVSLVQQGVTLGQVVRGARTVEPPRHVPSAQGASE